MALMNRFVRNRKQRRILYAVAALVIISFLLSIVTVAFV